MPRNPKDIEQLLKLLPPGSISRRRVIQGAAGLGLIGLTGLPLSTAFAQPAAPRTGRRLRVAAPPATTIDPVRMDSAGAIAIVQQGAEYLVWADSDLNLRPVLATAWRAEDGGRRWIFDLRRGVRFHDGREMTADDVVASFRRLVAPESGSPAKNALDFLQPDNVRAIDSHTVEFVLDRAVGAFPYYTHAYNAVILPADYAGDFAESPIGTGPFRLVSYRPQEGARFERNPDYWDAPKPYLDEVEIALYETTQPQLLALQAGEADVVTKITFLEARAIQGAAGVVVASTEASEHRQLTMNTRMKPFDDKRVRQAVALSFDRDALVGGLLGGLATVANDHPIAPIYPEDPNIPQRTQNIERARQLLAEAGYPNGIDVDLYTAQFAELPDLAVVTQQMLAPAGIRVNLHVEPLPVYYDHWTEVPFGLTDWTSRPTADQILSVFRSDADWNAAHWANPEFDRLFEEFQAEPDVARRQELATRIASIMNDEVPAVIPYFTRTLRALGDRVRGVEANMSNYLDLTEAWKDA